MGKLKLSEVQRHILDRASVEGPGSLNKLLKKCYDMMGQLAQANEKLMNKVFYLEKEVERLRNAIQVQDQTISASGGSLTEIAGDGVWRRSAHGASDGQDKNLH